jgi:protein-S-isoprenylcysteine O-methyltransferase Ste14
MKNNYSAWAARWRVPLGFAFAVLYLIFSQPTLWLLVVGGAVALLGLALRMFAAGHIEKDQRLGTSGPFAHTRNPLYLGSLTLGAGFMIAGGLWILAVAFVALFMLIYLPVMRREEDSLRQRFGAEFDEYARSVPLLVPIPGRRWHGAERFQWARYRANREYNAAIGYTAIVVLLLIKLVLRSHGTQINL